MEYLGNFLRYHSECSWYNYGTLNETFMKYFYSVCAISFSEDSVSGILKIVFVECIKEEGERQ